jgi:hypothetical protein
MHPFSGATLGWLSGESLAEPFLVFHKLKRKCESEGSTLKVGREAGEQGFTHPTSCCPLLDFYQAKTPQSF